PNKYVAAVHFALAAALDADPFLLLTLRGRSRDELLADLRTARSGEELDDEPIGGPGKEHLGISVAQLDAGTFFTTHDDLSDYRSHISQPDSSMSLLRRLGNPPGWGSPVPLVAM